MIKAKGDDLGLGLIIVRSLLTSCNGTISYESDGKTGVTFFVKFPAMENEG